jgi:hypothetical protein
LKCLTKTLFLPKPFNKYNKQANLIEYLTNIRHILYFFCAFNLSHLNHSLSRSLIEITKMEMLIFTSDFSFV